MDVPLSLPLLNENVESLKTAEILKNSKHRLGFIPNLYAMMANSEGLLSTYITGDENFRQFSRFTPVEQEIIYLAISLENKCDYCVSAHTAIAKNMTKIPEEIIDILKKSGELKDKKLNAVFKFTKFLVNHRGWADKDDVDAFLAAGYTEQDVLYIILAIGVKTLSNYMNHLTHTPVDVAFK